MYITRKIQQKPVELTNWDHYYSIYSTRTAKFTSFFKNVCFPFCFACVFVLEIMRLRSLKICILVFFCVFVFFLRLFLRFFVFFIRFDGFFFRSRINECRSRCILCSSAPCNMTLLFIKHENNMLYTYFKRQSKYLLSIKGVL